MITERNRLPDGTVVRSDKDGAFFRALTAYCDNYPLLSAEEEQRLGALAQGADVDAARRAVETLVRHNLRLVVYLARKYAGKAISLSELVDEGTMGLMDAAKHFEPRPGVRFATYAGYWIEQACGRAQARAMYTVHLPMHVVALRRKANREATQFMMEHGRVPTPAEMQSLTGASYEALDAALHSQGTAISLDSLDYWDSTDGDDGDPLYERLCDTSPAVEDVALDHVEHGDLYATLRRVLTSRELVVIAYLYRLGDAHVPYSETWDEEMTLMEVATRLGVSVPTVVKARDSALAKLRQAYGVSVERILARAS